MAVVRTRKFFARSFRHLCSEEEGGHQQAHGSFEHFEARSTPAESEEPSL
jgi:hypothetical protein